MDLEGDLHGALDADQFALVYQPIFEIRSGRLSGFEALLRWAHPTIGTIPPDRFIPILEINGQIVNVGAWVLEEACRTASGWASEPGGEAMPLSMSINVSSVQLASSTFVRAVQGVLARTGFDPCRLVLEITETSFMNDPDTVASRLHDLRALGVRVAIDDFGTGYSSLSYLHQFPTDILKLDRSFIDTINAEGPMPPLVKGLLDLARTLGIETVAEGIEEEHQLAELVHEQF
ncbi:MAG: diguanylate cyclase/phosphodiesterase (GGDEF & EAL domains) with PAS/PAC sensor(s) [uncultured Acidimicrobiales bacterium]|uniref:Diguanylate cyclase/phosphodiesterase (GGDEF & EAL domains) with PAS/PAC sensor(S) n=1 Tax=uncultured Acidimicrobiales bacterium TaxID=310071 RepID=A0A6J4J6C1_9ACTN|nr:MAG: diguanylate cyclase/phosphodiesterase (GGDEF & EAL domains) with PAS/PAC sensor(s) [uncultured Acidimicrobiales bacterium]